MVSNTETKVEKSSKILEKQAEETQKTEIDLNHPEYYINRELSLLAFHRRVLAQAKDAQMPLLERLRFLCIASTNLDEFFELRVAGLKQQVVAGAVQAGPDNLYPQEVLKRISVAAHEFVDEQYSLLNENLACLEKEGIIFLKRDQWNKAQSKWVREFFENELSPILSPIGLDPAHPFPPILNKSLNFIVSLKGKDAFGRDSGRAVVQAPRALPRIIALPQELSNHPYEFIFLSSILHAHVEDLFPGMKVTGCYQFRVTRNSDLFVDEEAIDDLLRALEGELPGRRYGDTVRLEVPDNCPDKMIEFLLKHFNLTKLDLYQVNGPVNLNRLLALPDLVDRPDLKYPSFTPSIPKHIKKRNLFLSIREGDILLHHPFQSFTPVIDFVRQAASDSKVLAIKQTLYRTSADSVIVDALVEAARSNKEVTVVIELRARFDEEANIHLATRLQEAGAHVVYGVVGYKTHAKMIMVVRREGKKLQRYVHLGTGNYHDRTARVYTDYGLLSCNKDIGEDVHKMFMQLTSLGRSASLKKMLQSPFTLYTGLLERIERAAETAREGKSAHIIAKMNALTEIEIIRALYRASIAGVKIDLIVRGICCLKPGIQGISENIHVRSIVGRFLEHTRCFYFLTGAKEEVYCGSADWMVRNLQKRVEECFPLEDKTIKSMVIENGLKLYLEDNTQAWELDNEGNYNRIMPEEGVEKISAQQKLLEILAVVT
jgi:polyphosphate kinase